MKTIIDTLVALIALPFWVVGSVAMGLGRLCSGVVCSLGKGMDFWDDVFGVKR